MRKFIVFRETDCRFDVKQELNLYEAKDLDALAELLCPKQYAAAVRDWQEEEEELPPLGFRF